MAIANNTTLLLPPFHDGEGPAWPIFNFFGVWIVVFDEVEQAQVPCVRGGKSADFDVVAHQVVCAGEFGDFSVEELFLVVPTGSPAQDATDIEILTHDVSHHVFGRDSLGGVLVVCASCSMHVMIAGIPA